MTKLTDRHIGIQILFIAATVLLIYTAASLQVFDDSYTTKVENVTLRKTTLMPSRGLIYDRNDKLLVKNEPIFELKTVYNEIDPDMDTTLFCDLLEISKEEFVLNTNKNWKSYKYSKNSPFTFVDKIDPKIYYRFVEHIFEFPGFYPKIKNIRNYPYPNAAQVIGYIGEVDQEKINSSDGAYLMGDLMGITGVEVSYEDELRGEKGIKLEIRDNLGRTVESYRGGMLDSSAVEGKNLKISIDIDLQAYGELLMQNKRGAIVAIEPSTGEILSLISSPTYDPNRLTVGVERGKIFSKLINDEVNKPLLNRAITSKYPPGSIFKPIVGLIAMQMGVTEPNRTIYCAGKYTYKTKYNEFDYKCHHHYTPYNIKIALQHSCNSYFFQLGRDIIEKYGFNNPGRGLDTMVNYLKDFGLGKNLDIDLFGENKGFVPNSKFYDNLYSNQSAKWRSTYVMSLGIGQGELELTTLQIANLAAIIANRGHYYTPHVVKEIGENKYFPQRYKEKHKVRIDKEHFEPIIEGLERVVLAGTAQWAHVYGLDICGKTGTSENYLIVNGKRTKMKNHSVFMAFAPKDNPQIAIAVFVENGGDGGYTAAPIAGLMIEKYINGEISFYREWLEKRILNTNLIATKENQDTVAIQ